MFPPTDTPRVFGLPPGANFARALAEGIHARLPGPPEALARVEIWVNTERFRRALTVEFADGPARLLPRIRVLADLSADPSALVDLPPATSALARKLDLARLVGRLLRADPELGGAAAAFDLADSLGDLLDEMQGEGVTHAGFARLDAGDHAEHWRRSLRFLTILADYAAAAPLDGQGRLRVVAEAYAAAWAAAPPPHPVIVAGSTGSRGATRAFMAAVARLPQGALVLPGFDTDLPALVWERLGVETPGAPDHPQHGFRRLTDALGMTPADVHPWIETAAPAPVRNRLLSLAMRPAPVTDQWRSEGAALTAGLEGALGAVTWVEAESPRTEARAVALALRRAAEEGVRAALVTPDRGLSRRVTAELARWGLRPDDSAGRPLALTPPGVLLRRLAALIEAPLTPETLLALLKHPLTASAPGARGAHAELTARLELAFLRGGPPELDWPALRAWAGAAGASAAAWMASLERALAPLRTDPSATLASRTARHRAAAEALAGLRTHAPDGEPSAPAAPGVDADEDEDAIRLRAPIGESHPTHVHPGGPAAQTSGLDGPAGGPPSPRAAASRTPTEPSAESPGPRTGGGPPTQAEAGGRAGQLDLFAPAGEPHRSIAPPDVSGANPSAAVGEPNTRVPEARPDVPGLDDAAASPVHDLWEKEAGLQARALMDALAAEGDAFGPISAGDYRALLSSLLAARDVPEEAVVTHASIAIWGTLEARVQNAELIVIGGLNETIWPRTPGADCWLSRPMRRDLGLPSPERVVGLSAHDFQSAMGAPRVLITRAKRDAEAPTVPSRWLLRLENLLAGLGPPGVDALAATRARGAALLAEAARLDVPDATEPLARRPSPRPPAAARPDRLSVTQIETLVRDPYAIYANKVLRLRRLHPLGRAPDAMARGSAIHTALDAFLAATADGLPPDARAVFLHETAATLARSAPWPAVRALWTARLARSADWFLATEAARRARGTPLAREIAGARPLDGTAMPFTVTAKADRIDRAGDGYALYDYKSGGVPSKVEAAAFHLQLPLEAAIAAGGGFPGLPAAPAIHMELVGLGQRKLLDALPEPAETWARLRNLIAAYQDPETGFTARLRPQRLSFESDYDHLSRKGEWGDGDDPDPADVHPDADAPTDVLGLGADGGGQPARTVGSRDAVPDGGARARRNKAAPA